MTSKSREEKLRWILISLLVASFGVGVLYPFVNDLLGVPTEIAIRHGSGFVAGYIHPHDPDYPTFLDGVLYRAGLWVTFLVAPFYLVPPAILLMPRVAFWLAAVVSAVLVLKYTQLLSRKKRFAYVYLVSGQIASFAAPLFVWHHTYAQSIFPEM